MLMIEVFLGLAFAFGTLVSSRNKLFVLRDGTLVWSPGWPGTYRIDQAGLKLTEICFSFLPSVGVKGLCHHARLQVGNFFSWLVWSLFLRLHHMPMEPYKWLPPLWPQRSFRCPVRKIPLHTQHGLTVNNVHKGPFQLDLQLQYPGLFPSTRRSTLCPGQKQKYLSSGRPGALFPSEENESRHHYLNKEKDRRDWEMP